MKIIMIDRIHLLIKNQKNISKKALKLKENWLRFKYWRLYPPVVVWRTTSFSGQPCSWQWESLHRVLPSGILSLPSSPFCGLIHNLRCPCQSSSLDFRCSKCRRCRPGPRRDWSLCQYSYSCWHCYYLDLCKPSVSSQMFNIKHEKMKGPKCGDKNKFRVHLVRKTDSLVEAWMTW